MPPGWATWHLQAPSPAGLLSGTAVFSEERYSTSSLSPPRDRAAQTSLELIRAPQEPQLQLWARERAPRGAESKSWKVKEELTSLKSGGENRTHESPALCKAEFGLSGLQSQDGPQTGLEWGPVSGTAPAPVGAWQPEAPRKKEILSRSEHSRILCAYLLPSWQFSNALSVGNYFPDTKTNQKPVQKRITQVPNITTYISFLWFYIQFNKNLLSTGSMRDTMPGAVGDNTQSLLVPSPQLLSFWVGVRSN